MYINVPAKQKPGVTLVITDAYHLTFLVVLFHPLSPYFQSFVPKENTAQTHTHTHIQHAAQRQQAQRPK